MDTNTINEMIENLDPKIHGALRAALIAKRQSYSRIKAKDELGSSNSTGHTDIVINTPVSVKNDTYQQEMEEITGLSSALPVQIEDWPREWKEALEERIAIMQYDGGLNAEKAEKLAEQSVREAFKRTKTQNES